jgi:hypothetical protein
MQLTGYAIVQKMERYLLNYMNWQMTRQNLHHLSALRDAAPFFDASAYRGTGRPWVRPLPSLDPKINEQFADTGCDLGTEATASRRFRELIGEGELEPDIDEDLFQEDSMAKEIFSLLDCPDDYELLRLSRREFPKSNCLLGYDIGYWGGDHFSLICDSFVAPIWHPPQPEAFHTLVAKLRAVNTYLLFPTPETAVEFRAWYRKQDWAETETGSIDEFQIIQVCGLEIH